MPKRPPDFALVLAIALHGGHGFETHARPPRLTADEVAGVLRRDLGLRFTAQQVGSWLQRLARKECPAIKSRDEGGYHSYSLTRWGRTEIHNKTKGLRRVMDWMPSPPPGFELRPKHLLIDSPTEGRTDDS
jgi:hypothetical protein